MTAPGRRRTYDPAMRKGTPLLPLLVLLAPSAFLYGAEPAPKNGPSRPAGKGCAWEQRSDAAIGLQAWVQRCDYGTRKIDFLFAGGALAMRYSDGGGPEPVVEVLALQPGEDAKAGLRRFFAAKTEPAVARRCVLASYRGDKPPAGVQRYTFVPDARYRKELDAKARNDEIPDPPCGDWGEAPDGIQYFEVQPSRSTRSVLFVRVGQDEPLFDEKTLRLLR